MVRAACAGDQDWILRLIDEARLTGGVWPGSWDSKKVADALAENRCLVAGQNSNQAAAPFVGSAFLIYRAPGEAWEIDLVAVNPVQRGRGLFRELLDALAQVALRQMGPKGKSCPVWLEVHEANATATAAYLCCGFREVGRRPGYYADGGTAILMTKDCL